MKITLDSGNNSHENELTGSVKISTYILWAVSLILLSVISRVIPHPWNFTAIGAVSLFSGAIFPWSEKSWQRTLGFFLPVIALFLGDIVIGFHNTMIYTYFATIFAVILGGSMRNPRASLKGWAGRGLLASVIFFVVTNFGVWMSQSMYPMNLSGLIECYAAGVPFFGTQVLGDFFYLSALLAAASWAKVPGLIPVPAKSMKK